MNYQFDLILKEGTEITEALADELFEAGCDGRHAGNILRHALHQLSSRGRQP